MSEKKTELFAIFAEAECQEKPLIMTDLTFGRLMDEIVVPYENKKPFFIDGVPVTREKLKKLKIIRQNKSFKEIFGDLHRYLRFGDVKRQKLYGEQYHIRLEALLRESGEDVTSQIIKAYDTSIRPRLKEYLPKREELISAALRVFYESMKILSTQ
jgi:hypothetical protein